jgi:hypothetical protein
MGKLAEWLGAHSKAIELFRGQFRNVTSEGGSADDVFFQIQVPVRGNIQESLNSYFEAEDCHNEDMGTTFPCNVGFAYQSIRK